MLHSYFSTPIVLWFRYHRYINSGRQGLPKSCPKNGDMPKSPFTIGSAGAIGWHNSDLKVDIGLHCGCRRHPHSGDARASGCVRTKVIFTKENTDE